MSAPSAESVIPPSPPFSDHPALPPALAGSPPAGSPLCCESDLFNAHLPIVLPVEVSITAQQKRQLLI